MKIYKTQSQVLKDVKDGVLRLNDNVTFECDVNLKGINIDVWDINAHNIEAREINALSIDANDIDAWYIYANNINASEITVYDNCTARRTLVCRAIKAFHPDSSFECWESDIVYREKSK